MDYASAPSRLRNPSSDNDVLFRVSKSVGTLRFDLEPRDFLGYYPAGFKVRLLGQIVV